jgi:hypothetical protein
MIQSKIAAKDLSRPDLDVVTSERKDILEFNKRGLFIGGAAKSGTTLLMSLLDNHPQLVVLPEETSYLEKRPEYLELENYQDKLSHLLENSNLRLLADGWQEPVLDWDSPDARSYDQIDYKRFVTMAKDFINRPWMNDSLLFSEMIRAYGIVFGANWRNCARWVEKTPRTESHPDVLDELFPDAKLIQIVRDPRAVFASVKNRIVNQYGYHAKAHRLVRSWNRSAREIPRLLRNASRFLVIRYEDLVRNPRDVLETICRFGGFDFTENMLEPTRAGNGWRGNSAFHKAFNGISTASVDQWKDTLTEQEIWWIEMHCRKGMVLANYPFQTDARFTWSRWLKRLPGESWFGYLHGRRGSICQHAGLLKECRYNIPWTVLKAIKAINYFPQLPEVPPKGRHAVQYIE